MKKVLIVLFALLVLVGCSDKGYSKLSNGDEVIFKGPDYEYKKDDLYKALKVTSASSIENDILRKIANNLNIDLTELEEEINELIDLYMAMGYDEYSVSMFKESYMASGIIAKLGEVYVSNEFDSFVEEDSPIKMQYAYFDTVEAANSFKADIANGNTFDTAAVNNGYELDCSVNVYLDSDNIPLNVKSYINSSSTTGVTDVIVVTNSTTDADGNITSTDSYYVLNIESRNVEEFKEEYIQAKVEVLGTDEIKNYMFENHKIDFYDQDIYEMMIAEYEALK